MTDTRAWDTMTDLQKHRCQLMGLNSSWANIPREDREIIRDTILAEALECNSAPAAELFAIARTMIEEMEKKPMSDTTLARTLITVPGWIAQDILISTIDGIVRQGCVPELYVLAVARCPALDTMSRYGDEILQFVEAALGGPLTIPAVSGWSALACQYLSTAVELWAAAAGDQIQQKTKTIQNATTTQNPRSNSNDPRN